LIWFKKSAEQGFFMAQIALGMMYGEGNGIARDDAQAGCRFSQNRGTGPVND
jgi:TPR repeat protein